MEKICLRSDFFPHLIFSLNDEHPLNFSLYKINKESTSSLASLSRNRKGKGSHADPRECLSLETPKKSRPENKKAPTTVSLSKKLEREWEPDVVETRPLSGALISSDIILYWVRSVCPPEQSLLNRHFLGNSIYLLLLCRFQK